MQASQAHRSSYVCKIGQADEKRLDAQVELTVVPLNEAITKWTERLDQNTISRILDFGCGVGSSKQELCKLFPNATYIGMDREEAQIAVARGKHPEGTFVIGDEKSETAREELSQADVVYMQFVAMHQTNLVDFFSNIVAHMKPRAQLLIFDPYSDFDKINVGNDPKVVEVQQARFLLSAQVAAKLGRSRNAVELYPILLAQLGMVNIMEYRKENMCFPLSEVRESLLIKNWETSKDCEHTRPFTTVDKIDAYINTLKMANSNTMVYIGDTRIIIAKKPA